MTEQRRLPRPMSRKHQPGEQAEAPALSAERARAFAAARSARERLLDEVLSPGEAEVLGAETPRPGLRDRAQADEEYVRMFTQQGGQ
jgi:hypothetical protein